MVSDDFDEDDETLEGMNSEPTTQTPSVYSPNSDSPTPTNSVHDKNWSTGRNQHWPNIGDNNNHCCFCCYY